MSGTVADHNARGIRFAEKGLFGEAIFEFTEALKLEPNNLEIYNNLGKTYNEAGDFKKTIEMCEQMLRLNPHLPGVLQNLGKTYCEMGRLHEGIAFYYQALERDPYSSSAWSDLLLTLNYSTATRHDLFLEHREFGRFDKQNVQEEHYRADDKQAKDKKVTIGYVSADIREHPLAHVFAPILKNHDRTTFKIILYNNSSLHDEVTDLLLPSFDIVRDISALSDSEAALFIKNDAVDILVDLSGHTAGNRLPLFGLKPAPIQVNWLGYMNTSGLRNMDYRITDEFLAPAGSEAFYTEKLWRIPDSFTFDPLTSLSPPTKLPALQNGYVTFGAFNNYKKVNDNILDLWARILKAVPQSQLILCAKGNAEFHQSIADRFILRGIDENRLRIFSLQHMKPFLDLVNTVDIALDTYPFSGCITVYHGLYAGVPSVVLMGETEYTRNGSAVMKKAGLPEFIARSGEEYTEIAVQYAQNLKELANIRKNLPGNLQKSNEAETITRDIEKAFLAMISR